jgi:hypothetical protein
MSYTVQYKDLGFSSHPLAATEPLEIVREILTSHRERIDSDEEVVLTYTSFGKRNKLIKTEIARYKGSDIW